MAAAGEAWSPTAVLEIVLRMQQQQQDDRARQHEQMMQDREYQHRRQFEQLLSVLQSARAGGDVSHHDGARTCTTFVEGDSLDNVKVKIQDIFTASGRTSGVRGREAADDYGYEQKTAAAQQLEVVAAMTAVAAVAQEQEGHSGAADVNVMNESVSQGVPGGLVALVATGCGQKALTEQQSGLKMVSDGAVQSEPMEQHSSLASARDYKENSSLKQFGGPGVLAPCDSDLTTHEVQQSWLARGAVDYNTQSGLAGATDCNHMRVPSDELGDCGDGSSIGECEGPHSSWNKGGAFSDSASRGPCHIVVLQRSDCAAESDADEQQPGPDADMSDYGQKESQEEPNGRGDTVGADACAESTGGGEAAASPHHENENEDEESEEIDEIASSFWHRVLNTVENELGVNGVAAAVQRGKELTCLRHPKLVPRKQPDGVYVCRTALVREVDGDVVLEVKVRASGDSMSSARDATRVALLHALVQDIVPYISEALEDEGESSEVQARAKAFLDGRVARAHRAAVLPVQLRRIELSCKVPY